MRSFGRRLARGLASASFAAGVIFGGPATRLASTLERTYAVATVDDPRFHPRHVRVPRGRVRRRRGPSPRRPAGRRG